MKHLFVKRRTSLPILFMYFLLISHLALSQTNSNVKKEDNLGIERVIVNLGTTIKEELHGKFIVFSKVQLLQPFFNLFQGPPPQGLQASSPSCFYIFSTKQLKRHNRHFN